MTGEKHRAEEWPEIRGDYQRLVALARLRLVGFEHHAEDVVARAIMKWRTIPAEKKSSGARIEQVIKTEAYSVLRAERRLQARQARVARDPTSSFGRSAPIVHDLEVRLLRRAIVETCHRTGVELTSVDVEVFELLLAGYTLSDVSRAMGLSRHEVKKVRAKWQNLLGDAVVERAG